MEGVDAGRLHVHMISEAAGTRDVYAVYVYSLISGGHGVESGRLAKNGAGLGEMALVGLTGLRGGKFLNGSDGLGLRNGDTFALEVAGVGGEDTAGMGEEDAAEVETGDLDDDVSQLVSDPFPFGGVVVGGSMIVPVVEMLFA